MWAEAAGSLLGGAASFFGQQQANIANAREAQANREFQERMSSTAHQREVEDLRKAGLNPILSAGGGGASTPSGAMPNIVSKFEGLASSAKDIGRLYQERRLLKAQADKAEAEARAAKKSAAIGDVAEPMIRSAGGVFGPLLQKSAEGWKMLQGLLSTPRRQWKDDAESFINGAMGRPAKVIVIRGRE